jgi:hypothetical protein
MVIDVVAHDLVEDAVELSVVAEDNMTAFIPREPLGIEVRSRVASGAIASLYERPSPVAEPFELAGAPQPARPRADDDNLR